MKKWMFICLIVVIILNGCIKQNEHEKTDINTNNEQTNEVLEKIDDIEDSIKLLEEQMANLQNEFEVEKDHNQIDFEHLSIHTSQNKHLLKHIPNIKILNGYIENINKTESEVILQIQKIDLIIDENEPNNYRLESGEFMEIILHDDILIYVLDGTNPYIVTHEDLNDKNEEYKRLFEFYIVEDKAILVSEQYLP